MLSKIMGNKMPQPIASNIALAKKVINESMSALPTLEKQKINLAKAHFTLSQSPKLSPAKTRLHLNSCISILNQVRRRSYSWAHDISLAYQRRAQSFEEEGKLEVALIDYKKILNILKRVRKLSADDYTLLAECNLAIADILIFQSSEKPEILDSSYAHANKAINCLLKANNFSQDLLSCLVYAHQTAGIAASENNFDKALSNFRTALNIIYNSNIEEPSELVAETFRYLSLVYTFKSINEQFYPLACIFEQCASIYSYLNNILSSTCPEDLDVESIEELTLTLAKMNGNPYMKFEVMQDLIDSLVYTSRHFSSGEYKDFFDLEFHFISTTEDIVEPLPTLFGKIVTSLLRTAFKFTLTPVQKSYLSIQKVEYDIKNMVKDFFDSKPCKIYEFKPRVVPEVV